MIVWRLHPVRTTLAVVCLAACLPTWAQRRPAPAPFTSQVERCIIPAADYHGVNQHILRAILRVESGLRPSVVSGNTNGTKDVGIGQINSMHFRELAQVGVMPEHLLNECVGTYVSAWYLRKAMSKHGNTWFGIAAYHSATPYYNNRYQVLLRNELIRSGALAGEILPVPPMRPNGRESSPRKAFPGPDATQVARMPALILNE